MTLLVILLFVAIASIGSYAVYKSYGSASEVRKVTEGVVPSALASADLVFQLKEVQLATIDLITAPNNKLATQSQEKLTAKKYILKEALDLQSRVANNDAQRGLVVQARESLENYFGVIDESVKLKIAGKNELAQANLFGNVFQYQEELEQIIQTLRVEKNRAKDGAISALNEDLSTTTTAIMAVTTIAMIILTAVSYLLYKQITGPIGRMQAMMSEIASSQDFTRRVPIHRMDEIGRSIAAFNEMISRIEESSVQLKQKTADIQAMLQNMPQGILTIVENIRIHPEYSAYMETIFETSSIAERDLMSLVFSDTNLGPDILSQVEAACRACIGEDAINFEFNKHLLVGEIEKKMTDGRVKVLDLSWSPITDEAGLVVRLMLCVRDVTELRKLAAEASEQKRKLEMIGEILGVTQEKFHEFVIGSMDLINKNELIIRQNAKPEKAAIDELFRNMHTVKGNARTYGLQHLTNIVHKTEQGYEELRAPHPNVAWDQQIMLEDLTRVRGALENYAAINEVSLGRKGPGRRGSVERYLMVEMELIQESLHRLETVNTANLHDLLSAHNTVRKTLRLLGTEQIGETLSGIIESIPSLAKELGKEVPNIVIDDRGYRIRNQASGMLKNVFMHLMRNSVDHGIETPQVRTANGKPAAGTIHIRMGVEKGMLNIALFDDGRGLALARIRKAAIERGLIHAGTSFGDDELANLIFRPGFSTADRVTEVSGRGVGMDAVQDFIKRENGKLEIRFTDDLAGAEYRQFKIMILLPESYAAYVDIALNDGTGKPPSQVAGDFANAEKNTDTEISGIPA